MTVVQVDPQTYTSAAQLFYQANRNGIDTLARLSSSLAGSAQMAGSDSGGTSWAQAFDPAAAGCVRAGADLANSAGVIGNLLGRSGTNHAGADACSTIGTGAAPHAAGANTAESITPTNPPSASGGPVDPPLGWSLVAHLLAYAWPNGDQGKLRAAAAEAACTTLAGHARDLSTAYGQLGDACDAYATHLDQAHQEVISELLNLLAWTAAIETGGFLVGVVTAGAAEVAAQAAEAAEIAATAGRIGVILARLLELVAEVARTIAAVAVRVAEITSKIKGFLSAQVRTALTSVAKLVPGLGRAAEAGTEVVATAAEKEAIQAPTAGMKVWRVYGEAQDAAGEGLARGSRPFGESWTPKDPRLSTDFRFEAGLPDENPGRFIIEGVLKDPASVTETRDALEIAKGSGGWPEYLIKDADQSVDVTSVSGVNEPWTKGPGDWKP